MPLLHSFPGNEAHKLFSGGPKSKVLDGDQKVYVEKVYGLFLSLISEGFLKGSLKWSLKGFSKPLQNAFKNPSKTLQEGVEIDNALGFPGL